MGLDAQNCGVCGTRLSGSSRYCERCGTSSTAITPIDSSGSSRPKIAFGGPSSPAARVATRSRRRAVIGGLAFLAIGGITAAVLIGVLQGGESSETTSRTQSVEPTATDPVVELPTTASSSAPQASVSSSTSTAEPVEVSPEFRLLDSPAVVATTDPWLRTAIASVAVGPNHLVVSGTAGGESFIWSSESGELIGVLDDRYEHGDAKDPMVGSAAVNADGSLALTGSHDGWLRLWSLRDVVSGVPIASWRIGSFVRAVAFGPSGTAWAAVASDGGVYLGNGTEITDGCDESRCYANLAFTEDLYSVAFSPDGQHLAVGGTGGLARVVNLRTFSQSLLDVTARDVWVLAVAFDPSGRFLALGGGSKRKTSTNNGRVWIHDLSTPEPALVGGGRAHTSPVFGLEFSPDGEYLLSASQDGTARVWDWEGAGLEQVVSLDAQGLPSGERCWMNGARFTADGTAVVGVCGKLDWDGFGVVWRFREIVGD